MPVPNRGAEVEGGALVRGAIEALSEALHSFEPLSELFEAVNESIKKLNKAVPSQQFTPGIERNAMLRFMMAMRRKNPMLGALAAGGGAQQPSPTPAPVPPPNPAAAGAA